MRASRPILPWFYYATMLGLAAFALQHLSADLLESHHVTELFMLLGLSAALAGITIHQLLRNRHFRQKAALYETLITNATDAVVITTADLDSPGPIITYVNKAFSDISGYTAEEAIGKSPRFLQGEFTKRETLDALRKALSQGKPFKDELLNYRKDGTPYWLEISIVPVKDSDGRITHYAGIERDISARKKEEVEYKNMWVQLKRANLKAEATSRELQESLKRAEEANKAKGDFLANMSHELRTPMNGVLGMAQLLADMPMDSEQREYVSTINSSAESLLMLLNDILDFSKIEAGALLLENIPYSPADAIRHTANLLAVNATGKGVDFFCECDSNLPAHIMGDPGRLRQVITNLLGNAIKFTDRGHVGVQARLLEQDGTPWLHVRVEDTGLGIPAGKLHEIFEKFTQADASITRRFGGTGLGLAISKQLVALMQGTIGVESVEGKGSTFWFSIPCRIPTHEELEAHGHIETVRKRPQFSCKPMEQARVLLVEDYPVNRVFAEKLLRKFGFTQIDSAENGWEALLKYRSGSYDIIFMDCQMPEIDGYLATRKIREFEANTPMHTPIVAMTANAMVGDREKCLKAGMDDYLSKPLRVEHVRSVLQSYFNLGEVPAAPAAPVAAPAATPQEPVVDMEQLRLFTDGNAEEECELIELFVTQADDMLAVLGNSLDDAAKEAWKSAAHRFKGSSGNLGANRLHRLCKRAEAAFEAPRVDKEAMLATLRTELDAVRTLLASYKR
jgi:PAS domain S-box-containing protein